MTEEIQRLELSAPAKLNLFLHIVGRHPNGYHNLQSVFVPIDLFDTVILEKLESDEIDRIGDIVGDPEKDLCVKAARLLKDTFHPKAGVRIRLTKRIPSGAGLGGGSSDAASTLLGLNTLWDLRLTTEELIRLAERIGADVPFFILGAPAFVEGIGEKITAIDVPDAYVALAMPQKGTDTSQLYASPLLTRDTRPTVLADVTRHMRENWPALFGRNDMQKAAIEQNFDIATTIKALGPGARMTGSGSAVFRLAKTMKDVDFIIKSAYSLVSENTHFYRAKILTAHPFKKT